MHLPKLRPRRSCGMSFGMTPRLLSLHTDLTSFGAEGREEAVEAVGKVVGRNRVDDVLTALLLVHQTGFVKNRQMLRDRGHRHVEFGGYLTDGHRSAGKVIENASSGG